MTHSRTLSFALLIVMLGALGCLWSAWCQFPFQTWNDVRLAPAFALRYGVNPYPPLDGGPLFTWIYGPIGILANLPATLGRTPESALQIACVINAVMLSAPAALIFFGSDELRAHGLRLVAFSVAVMVMLLPSSSLMILVADHYATGFGLLSCWCLARGAQLDGRRLPLAAALCVIAIWSKQVAVFLAPAQILFVLLYAGRSAAIRYAVWVSLFGFLALALFSVAFGFNNLWLNLVAIPGRLPWSEVGKVNLRPGALIIQIIAPAIGLFILCRNGFWQRRESEAGRFFQITVFAALALLPAGLVGYFKIGGDMNSLYSASFLVPSFLLAWLTSPPAATSPESLRVLVLVTVVLAIRVKELASLPDQPLTWHLKAVAPVTAAFPHALWFPQNPVVGFYADGKIWHSEDGLLTRNLAGFPIRQTTFRRYLPPDLKGVVYPSSASSPVTMSLLAEHNQIVEFPFWTLHTRVKPSLP